MTEEEFTRMAAELRAGMRGWGPAIAAATEMMCAQRQILQYSGLGEIAVLRDGRDKAWIDWKLARDVAGGLGNVLTESDRMFLNVAVMLAAGDLRLSAINAADAPHALEAFRYALCLTPPVAEGC